MSCVGGGVYSPVDSRDPVSNSAANTTREIRREPVANSIQTADATLLDSNVESRRRRRCALDIRMLYIVVVPPTSENTSFHFR